MIVSTLVAHLEQLSPDIESLHLTGANLSKARSFGYLLRMPEIEALEVFVSPGDYQRQGQMAAMAQRILPPERMGKGALRFYPVHRLEEVWKDGQPRILLTLDTDLMARDRYLRDRFAIGPTAICCQTHGMGLPETFASLAEIADQEPVSYDMIACLSSACKANLERTFDGYLLPTGAPLPCRLEVVHNPVDCERFRPSDADARLRARTLLNLPREGTIALCLGRLTPNSKADLLPLIRQFAANSGPGDHLVIVGIENTSGYAAALGRAGEALGIGDRLIVRPHLQIWAAPLYYSAADLFVFPGDNIQEAFANTVVEAMASGLPVLVSDWDGPRDLVIEGENGFRVPTYLMPGLNAAEDYYSASPIMATFLLAAQNVWVDEKALGERLKLLLGDSELRGWMGERGREIAEKNHHWRPLYDRLFLTWRELLEEAGSESPEARERRRAAAEQSRHRIPLGHLYEPYATSKIDPERATISVTELGESIVGGRERLEFYDEALPLIRPALVEKLLLQLRTERTFRLSSLAGELAASTGETLDAALFHIGLFAKRGVIRIDIVAGSVL